MTIDATRGAIFSVGAALVLLFAFTVSLTREYRDIRRGRAEDRYMNGLRLAREGRYEQATEEFRAALTYSHDEPAYRLELAKSLTHLGKWNEAESHLTDLRQGDPTNGPINLMLARIAARTGREKEAIADYNRAIYGYWPDNPEQNRASTRLELFALLDRSGEQKQALAELLQLAGEVPASDVATRQKVAGMLLSHGSPQSAADIYRGIIALQPQSAAAEQGLGQAEFDLGNFADARNAFLAASRLEPSDNSLKQKIASCDAILNLDPTLLRLSAGQRFDRAQELLRRVYDSANQCGAVSEEMSGAAQTALSEKPKRMREGDTVAMLNLVQEIWKARLSVCPQAAAPPALAAVMSKILKQ